MLQSDIAATQEIVPPSTGKRRKARRVFGNILLSRDPNCSLSYTPSPIKTSENSDDTTSSSNQRNLATNLFSIAESTVPSVEKGNQSRNSESSDKISGVHSDSRGHIVCQPFSRIIDEQQTNKENQTVPKSIRVQSDEDSADLKLSISELRESYSESVSPQDESVEESQSNRDSGKSVLRPAYIEQKEKKKVNDSEHGKRSARSVNQAMNAARKAKEMALQQKARLAAKIRDEWREEKKEALTFQQESERIRRQQLDLQNQLSSKFSKTRAQKNIEQREIFRKEVEQESMFKSEVAREHQRNLKEKEEKCRRQSIAIREKIRANKRIGAEQMKLARIEEDRVIFEERHNFSKAREDYLKDRAASVRKNYQFKAGDARRIRGIHDRMETQRKNEEHESFESMLAAARDADSYHKDVAERRRRSLAARNQEARKQRGNAEQERSQQLEEEHQSYELKWAAESDAENYKRQLEERRRESLAFRNQEARKYRERLAQQNVEGLVAEHQSYELKFEAERDVEAYKREQAELRRQSLEQRGQFARSLKERLNQQEAERIQAEQESYKLKFAAENDADVYRDEMEEMRRKSLEFRNKEAKRQRNEEDNRRVKELEQQHEDYELKWDGERDAASYFKRLQDERRQSLENHRLEARKRRELDEAEKATTLQAEQQSFELTRAAYKDVEEYKQRLEQKRRESLAFRNKEKARHAKVMDEIQSLAREQEAESYVLKWAGEDDVKAYLAEVEAKRRKSLQFRGQEARRHRDIKNETYQQEIFRNQEDEALRSACKSLRYSSSSCWGASYSHVLLTPYFDVCHFFRPPRC